MKQSVLTDRSLRPVLVSTTLAASDVVALFAAFIVAYQLRSLEAKPFLADVAIADFAQLTVLMIPAWVVVFSVCGLYAHRPGRGRLAEAGRVMAAVTLGVGLLMIIDYLSVGVALLPGRKVAFYALALGVALVVAGRLVVRRVLHQIFRRGRALHNIAIVGTGPLAERVAGGLLKSLDGNQIVAAVSQRDAGGTFLARPVYARLEQALDSHRVPIHEVVHADPEMDRAETETMMQTAVVRGLGYRFVPNAYGVFAAGASLGTVAGLPVMEVRLTALRGWGAVGKRLLDVIGAAVGLFLLAPLFLAVALAVKVGDPAGPVLYRQERLGQAGRRIGLYKFRSMLWAYSTGPDRPFRTAEEAFAAMGRSDLIEEFGRDQKVQDDPRVSNLGRFLRRTSLDELPQLINALLGHISLVGPRPITPMELERYGQHRASFLALKPGITGLWQVSGRSSTSYAERVKLDVFYVENWNHALDLTILARTVVTVAARRGAV